ncbi:MAG: TIM barrel protein [Bacteroidaceae bacterium]|jgi:sugar phosphate isomerase/epimerase|nr:TIM barrel protein [Bacteroidaceae bacterium]
MKKYILLSLLAIFLGSFAAPAKTAPLPKKNMCLQLYSIRDLIGSPELYAKNHVKVFKELATMGYTDVEPAFYGDGKFYGISPEQFRKDVESAGLKVLSSHTTRGLSPEEIKNHDFTEAMKWWDQCIAAHKAAGAKYIVTPGFGTPKTLEEGQVLCDYHNAIGQKCRENGIKYGYHSHSHEFQKVEDQVWYDYMLNHIAPENMFFQMDVYWAVMAQVSPVSYFKKYPGRFKLLHIKDKYELGESGMVGFDAIFRHAAEAGLENFVVELEGTDGTIDIMEGVRRSANYIRSSNFVKASYSKR